MFSGIISSLGVVEEITTRDHESIFTVRTHYDDLSLGESVAFNGVCLTVTEILEAATGLVTFFVSKETLQITSLHKVKPSHKVNLERALMLTDRLSGHMVSGHVDTRGTLVGVCDPSGLDESFGLSFEVPQPLANDCILKGSITIEGISLTINGVKPVRRDDFLGAQIEVRIIPHTWKNTTLQFLKLREEVNIETDMISKLIRHHLQNYLNDQTQLRTHGR